jgi:alpha-beta hydrolase superfamily lysophospholipase
MILFSLSVWRSAALSPNGVSAKQPGDYVVLLHGLGRTAWSMKGLEWDLRKEGYKVINVSYPSTRLSIQDASDACLAGLLQERTSDRSVKIHFVTHSLGGIVLRQYLKEHQVENLGRVVMMAPPNRGSELADKLRNNYLYQILTGLAGQQLGTELSSLPNQLGPAAFDLGIIAGDRSLNPWFSAWIPGPDDGKVSVQSTPLDGMKDFRIVFHSHTWMMWRRDVTALVKRFLQSGNF